MERRRSPNARQDVWVKFAGKCSEKSPAAAQALIEEAQTTIAYIADHAGREDLRDTFLELPLVQKLLSDPGEKRG